jgi:hypothetical protein
MGDTGWETGDMPTDLTDLKRAGEPASAPRWRGHAGVRACTACSGY